MSSPFQKQFSSKSPMSPLNGAYTEGKDRDITTYRQSDRELFDKLQNDILGGVLASDKKDPCQKLEERFSSGAIGKERYEQGLKNCASKEEEKNNKNLISTEKGTGSAGSGKTTGSASMFPGFG